jgi:hypothetical protein
MTRVVVMRSDKERRTTGQNKVDHNLHSFIHTPPIHLGTGRSNTRLNFLKAEESIIKEYD